MPRLYLSLAVLLTACNGFDRDLRDCSTVDTTATEVLPRHLSETGLYADITSAVLSPAALEFRPRFPLWTDTAAKRRWLVLPEGGQVDTRDPEHWIFPVGTKLFKEFVRDGVLVETRISLRGEDGWTAASYVWNGDLSDATIQLATLNNASETSHDVPGAAECLACHGGRGNFALGFSATQLDLATREELYLDGVLSHPVTTQLELPPDVEAGLGYLHGNCSHCHNSEREEQPQATDCYSIWDNFDLTLPSDLDNLASAPALETAGRLLGSPSDSEVLKRISKRNLSNRNPSMPPLGTELIDEEGLATVEAFIEELTTQDR